MEQENKKCCDVGGCSVIEHMKHHGVRCSLVVLFVMLTVFVFAKAVAEFKTIPTIGKNIPATNVISVSGKGEVVAPADIAEFSFSVTEENIKIGEAQKVATKKINDILDFLKKQGIDSKDIKTTGYTINPRYEYDYDKSTYANNRRLVAYVVSQSTDVKVRKLEDAGVVMAGLGALGANDISGLTFKVDKEDDLLKEARSKAIAEARQNAEKLAGELGVDLVRITSYYDQQPAYPVYNYMRSDMMVGASAKAESVAPEMPAGVNKFISNVTISYEIR